MSELRKLLKAAINEAPWSVCDHTGTRDIFDIVEPSGEFSIGSLDEEADAALIVHLRNNAEKYAGMEERIAELESQLEASLGALREQMKARRDACARLGAVEGGLRIAAIYVRAALQGDGGQE